MSVKFTETQWSTMDSIAGMSSQVLASWIPDDEKPRIASYVKYDELYWNDPRQYALRVMEGENPLYIPNPRNVVDTTSHFLLKGLKLTCEQESTQKVLDDFLKRELFYSRFNDAKRAGVARGDFVFHMTANPNKAAGSRISLNSVPASDVFPIWDEDMPGHMVGCNIAIPYELPNQDPREPPKLHIRKLTYKLEEDKVTGTRRIFREEAIYRQDHTSFGVPKLVKAKVLLPPGYLHDNIQHIPIYWFKNKGWDGEDYGSSELRGVERIAEVISQGATDISGALALEGLGVYATDGGRPVELDANGVMQEVDWEISPGKVLEHALGTKFSRIQGVGSITPAAEQIEYLEGKMNEALGISDIALGTVDAQVANSGIALSIKFLPTLAKIDDRDQWGKDKLTHLFYDWKTWYAVFEKITLTGDIVPTLGEKLPLNRQTKMNELNNMKDRSVISRAYYRKEMEALGYSFPDDMEQEILDEIQRENQARTFISPDQEVNNEADEPGKPGTDGEEKKDKKLSHKDKVEKAGTNGDTLPSFGNSSNNKNRPNESGGSETKPK